jgi:hypothetical protein
MLMIVLPWRLCEADEGQDGHDDDDEADEIDDGVHGMTLLLLSQVVMQRREAGICSECGNSRTQSSKQTGGDRSPPAASVR